jgi:hypothetical protein
MERNGSAAGRMGETLSHCGPPTMCASSLGDMCHYATTFAAIKDCTNAQVSDILDKYSDKPLRGNCYPNLIAFIISSKWEVKSFHGIVTLEYAFWPLFSSKGLFCQLMKPLVHICLVAWSIGMVVRHLISSKFWSVGYLRTTPWPKGEYCQT